jgi:hypothetical protein
VSNLMHSFCYKQSWKDQKPYVLLHYENQGELDRYPAVPSWPNGLISSRGGPLSDGQNQAPTEAEPCIMYQLYPTGLVVQCYQAR